MPQVVVEVVVVGLHRVSPGQLSPMAVAVAAVPEAQIRFQVEQPRLAAPEAQAVVELVARPHRRPTTPLPPQERRERQTLEVGEAAPDIRTTHSRVGVVAVQPTTHRRVVTVARASWSCDTRYPYQEHPT